MVHGFAHGDLHPGNILFIKDYNLHEKCRYKLGILDFGIMYQINDYYKNYTKEEFDIINNMIDHDRDLTFTYAAMKQLEGKYLVQDRTKNKIYESPQFVYIMIALILFNEHDKETRLEYVQKFYDAILAGYEIII